MRKIFLFVTAALCSVTMAFAQEDTRTVISDCVFTGTLNNPETGDRWDRNKWAAVAADLTAENPCYFIFDANSSSYMQLYKKKEDNSWEKISRGYGESAPILTAGTYRYQTQLRIENGTPSGTTYGDSYRLANDGSLTLTVAGESWTVSSVNIWDGGISFTWATSPEFVLEKKTLPFVFSFNNDLNYGVQVINTAITEKNLKAYTTGGTEEYSYRKLTNHVAWLNVSNDGIISGTPTAICMDSFRDSIEVSDGIQKDTFAITAGKVAPLPADREVVSSASFTNFTTPKIGDVNNTSYRSTLLNAIVRPEGVVYQLTDAINTRFYKVVNDQTVQMADGEAFAEGTYKMGGQIRIDGNNGYFYVLDSENDLTATMDGKAMQISAGSTQDTYSYRFYSHEFTIVGLADGYYLAGSFNNWEPSEDDMLVANTSEQARQGEMVIKGVTLSLNDEFKIGRAENGVIPSDNDHWYGSGQGNNNFVVTDAFAGVKDIYFVPTWQDDWNGHIWVATHTPTAVENVAAEIKAVKRIVNGQLLIIRDGKIYNAQGARVQ